MAEDRYRQAFEEVRRDCEIVEARIRELRQELDTEEDRLAQLRRLYNALADMYGEPLADEPHGLTGTIRDMFQYATEPLTTAEVRGRLELSDSRINLKTHKNPDASIAAVIKRLEDAGEIVRTSKIVVGNGRQVTRLAFAGSRARAIAEEGKAAERKE